MQTWISKPDTLRPRGFTLLELLIVVAIIGLLASVIMVIATGVAKQRKIVLALTQVKGIEEGAKRYAQDLGKYPPDTDAYEADDPLPEGLSGDQAKFAISRYLGFRLIDTKSGAANGPYLEMQPKFLKGDTVEVDGKQVQYLVDPWGNPYEMDCMHVKYDKATKKYSKASYPYAPGTPEDQFVFEAKVWSKGPDGKSSLEAPYFPESSSPEDDDNIMSWTNQKRSVGK